jgi:tetratricopeptide (TPR) repeat protein
MAVMMSAMLHENEGDVDTMAADLHLALDGFRSLGERWGTSLALRGLAVHAGAHGNHQQAVDASTEALRLIGELGTTEGTSQLLGQRALSRAELDDLDGAREDLQQAMRMAEEAGSRSSESMALIGLANLARRTGRLDEALDLAQRAYAKLDLHAERVAPHGQAMVLAQLGRVEVARGDLATAWEHSREALELALTTEDMPLLASIVEMAADVELLAGDAELAARTLGLAAALRGVRTVADSDIRSSFDRARAALGAERFEAIYQTGTSQTRDDATAELRKRFSPEAG